MAESGGKKKKQKADRKATLVLIFIAIIIFALAGGLVYGLNQQTNVSFSTFQSNFASAANVAIIVTAYNGTALSATVGCATNLIEQLVSTHSTAHKNSTSINFYILNRTQCVYSSGLGQHSGTNYTHSTPQQCIGMTNSIPRVFINYSAINKTVITPTSLYVSGNINYLVECGVASEITAGP